MGLEKEKLDTNIIIDEDEINRSIEPILSKIGMEACMEAPDRDPHDINAHLKVNFSISKHTNSVAPDYMSYLHPT